jgi:hypothetical protein
MSTAVKTSSPRVPVRDRLSTRWEIFRFHRALPRRLRLSHALRLLVVPDERSLRPMPEARREIENRIKRLVDGGAVDEGCGDVLDRLVDSWAEQQRHEIEKKYLARRTVIQELLAQVRDRQAAARMPSRMLAARRRSAVRALRQANERLLGTTFVDEDEVFGWADAGSERRTRERRA